MSNLTIAPSKIDDAIREAGLFMWLNVDSVQFKDSSWLQKGERGCSSFHTWCLIAVV